MRYKSILAVVSLILLGPFVLLPENGSSSLYMPTTRVPAPRATGSPPLVLETRDDRLLVPTRPPTELINASLPVKRPQPSTAIPSNVCLSYCVWDDRSLNETIAQLTYLARHFPLSSTYTVLINHVNELSQSQISRIGDLYPDAFSYMVRDLVPLAVKKLSLAAKQVETLFRGYLCKPLSFALAPKNCDIFAAVDHDILPFVHPLQYINTPPFKRTGTLFFHHITFGSPVYEKYRAGLARLWRYFHGSEPISELITRHHMWAGRTHGNPTDSSVQIIDLKKHRYAISAPLITMLANPAVRKILFGSEDSDLGVFAKKGITYGDCELLWLACAIAGVDYAYSPWLVSHLENTEGVRCLDLIVQWYPEDTAISSPTSYPLLGHLNGEGVERILSGQGEYCIFGRAKMMSPKRATADDPLVYNQTEPFKLNSDDLGSALIFVNAYEEFDLTFVPPTTKPQVLAKKHKRFP